MRPIVREAARVALIPRAGSRPIPRTASPRRLAPAAPAPHPRHACVLVAPAPQTKATPLHYASENGKTECVQVLLSAGADVGAVDEVRTASSSPLR